MIIRETGSKSYKLLTILVSIWNPFPRRIKVVKGDRYILDTWGRMKSRRITQKELARRRANGEEERQCFTISARGSVVLTGKTD